MKKKSDQYELKQKDLPATQGMLLLVRKELKSDIKSLEHKMESRFKKVDARFSRVDARFNAIDARFNEVDARFDKVDARFKEVDARFDRVDERFNQMDSSIHQIAAGIAQLYSVVEKNTAEIARVGLLVEEQNSRNRVVLEGLAGLFHRQERIEKRMDAAYPGVRE